MWNGWTKNLYLLYGRSLSKMLSALVEIVFLDFAPPLALGALCLTVASGHGSLARTVVASALFVLVVWRYWNYRQALGELGFDPNLANYQLPGSVLFSLLLLKSASAHRLTRRIQWKGRTYRTQEPE
jgi:hypothetical protein